ncbi:MAG: hypothetical protein NTW86_30050 [Candidatus Sumerlaeota bacterium]|nr:hypothetical protein [Candidatus Sumerlaeota bacterium]
MSVQSFIRQLVDRGVQLSVHDGHIRYRVPKGVFTSDLLELLRANKQLILRMARAAAADPPSGSESLFPCRFHSDLLGEEILIVCESWAREAESPPSVPVGQPVHYSLDEMVELACVSPQAIQAVHRVKRYFGGRSAVSKGREHRTS